MLIAGNSLGWNSISRLFFASSNAVKTGLEISWNWKSSGN